MKTVVFTENPSWLDAINPQINIVWHGGTADGFVEPARRLFDNELVVVTQGECTIQIEDQSFFCGAGHFLIVPPDAIHTTVCQSRAGVYRYCIHFMWEPGGKPRPASHSVTHPARIPPHLVHATPAYVPKKILHGRVPLAPISDILAELTSAASDTDSARRASTRALLLQILLLLLGPRTETKAAHEPRSYKLAKQVRDLLYQPVRPNASIRSLLETLGFSYAHLNRVFKAQYAVTPTTYLNALRIERAKLLLRNPRFSIGEVAYQVGFSNPKYFSRIFRKHTGMAPREFP